MANSNVLVTESGYRLSHLAIDSQFATDDARYIVGAVSSVGE